MLRELGEEIGRRGRKCQECGNQAKKGCEFMRCRSCCNNKGFRCQTHVKSTWVSTSRRRYHLHHLHHHHQQQQQQYPQTHKHIINVHPSSSGLEELNKFPATMSSMAVFRCVRMQSEDDAVDEYAYQTSVNIGGRVFSGLLYDQGPQSLYNSDGDGGESCRGPLILDLHHHMNINSNIDAETVAMAAPLSPTATAHHFASSSYPLSLGAFRPPHMP